MLSGESALALWVVGQQRLTDCWLFSREKQEVGGQLKELKDQLEAEQYFTVTPIHRCFLFFFLTFLHLRSKHVKTRRGGTTKSALIPAKTPPHPTPFKTLYKTQIRELKDECDQKSKQGKELQRRLADYKEER